jgi:hypothetical protein
MTEQEAIEIIRREQLTRVNWYNENNLKENEVGIRKTLKEWEVYITGEKAEIITGTECRYENADDAYEALIKKGRYVKKLFG